MSRGCHIEEDCFKAFLFGLLTDTYASVSTSSCFVVWVPQQTKDAHENLTDTAGVRL